MTASLLAQTANAKTLEVGADKAFKALSGAVASAADGDRIVIDGGEYFDCAVVHTNNLVIEGAGGADATVLTDKACQGKALLVVTGSNVTIRNMTLTRVRVPDGNGAGIRAEGGGNLLVDSVRFVNNEDGLLAGDHSGASITIRNSEFIDNGTCKSSCAHGVYVGAIDLLHIENTKFFQTKEGHHIKTRAARTEIVNCDIKDGERGTSSYLIDVPNGGSLIVRGSKLEKGANSQNHTAAIVIGEEGVKNRTAELSIEGNVFHNDGGFETYFVNNITATEAHLKSNQISGRALPLKGDGDVDGGAAPRHVGMTDRLRSTARWGATLWSGGVTPLLTGLIGAAVTYVLVRRRP